MSRGTDNSRGSLPHRVSEMLRQEILRGLKPGEKLPTMRALRDRLDVSINTVGAALDLLAGEGLIEKRQGSGIYVTERAGRPRIGILSELDLFDMRISPCFRAVAGELKRRLDQLGAEPRLYIGSAEPGDASDTPTCPQFWDDIAAGVLDAGILQDTPSSYAWQERVRDCPIPLVGWGTDYLTEIDSAGIIRAAVAHLAAEGCRRIGLLAWHQRAPFLAAVAAHGLETRDAWIRCELDPACRGAGWEQFREIWIGGGERPDGLVVLDDMLFADAQLAILELGIRPPRDLHLAVQLNRDASPSVRLPIEAFEINPAAWACQLADMAMARYGGEAIPTGVRLLPFTQIHHEILAITNKETC